MADIAGNVTAQTSVKETDDFHVAVNKDWLTSVDMSGGTMQVSSFTERAEEVKEEILALLRDSSQTSMEAKLTQQFYNTYLDMKTRNAQGMEPVSYTHLGSLRHRRRRGGSGGSAGGKRRSSGGWSDAGDRRADAGGLPSLGLDPARLSGRGGAGAGNPGEKRQVEKAGLI